MNDFIDIPIEDLEPIGTPGMFRVKPTPTFLAWAQRQRLILIVPPKKEDYQEWKRIASEKPDSWYAQVLALPENQELLVGLED